MQNVNYTTKNLKIAGFYESRTGRWYVTEDRAWKVRLNINDEATAIRNSNEVYRLIGDTTFDSRTRRPISPRVTTHQDVVALVAQARAAGSK